MDRRSEIRDFLASRRARITPQQAGLPAYGAHRRVPRLRREEVAMLAGVSDYYTRLERGNLDGASEGVLEGIAAALQLDEAERTHLFDLARTTARTTARPRRGPGQQRVRPSVQTMLDAMTGAPAVVRNGRLDILATNPLGRALYAPLYRDPVRPANHARFCFLDPAAHEFWVDWERAANDTVGILRTEAGRTPCDKALSDLVGELSTRSEDFRTRWAKHNVNLHRTGAKRIHHPVVGRLELDFEMLHLPADPELAMLVYTPQPGTPSADALQLLASWAASQNHPDMTPAAEPTPSGSPLL